MARDLNWQNWTEEDYRWANDFVKDHKEHKALTGHHLSAEIEEKFEKLEQACIDYERMEAARQATADSQSIRAAIEGLEDMFRKQ